MTQTPTDALRLVPDCQCNRCAQEAVDADGGSPFDPCLVRMFCCIQCGNKRCPHATDHRLSCTGSNEAGQEGSSYGPPLKSRAPASPLPGGGWHTNFDDAPKDGRWIVTIDKWRNAETMRWSNEVSRLFPEQGERGWVAKGGYSPNTRPELSVAWAELPAAPTGDAT